MALQYYLSNFLRHISSLLKPGFLLFFLFLSIYLLMYLGLQFYLVRWCWMAVWCLSRNSKFLSNRVIYMRTEVRFIVVGGTNRLKCPFCERNGIRLLESPTRYIHRVNTPQSSCIRTMQLLLSAEAEKPTCIHESFLNPVKMKPMCFKWFGAYWAVKTSHFIIAYLLPTCAQISSVNLY
jgi:hypothetical protein